jgi:hypothetical protein
MSMRGKEEVEQQVSPNIVFDVDLDNALGLLSLEDETARGNNEDTQVVARNHRDDDVNSGLGEKCMENNDNNGQKSESRNNPRTSSSSNFARPKQSLKACRDVKESMVMYQTTLDGKDCFHAFVGNLSWWTSEELVCKTLRDIGVHDLMRSKMAEDKSTGASKGYCLIVVESLTSMRIIRNKLTKMSIKGMLVTVKSPIKRNFLHYEQLYGEFKAKRGTVVKKECSTKKTLRRKLQFYGKLSFHRIHGSEAFSASPNTCSAGTIQDTIGSGTFIGNGRNGIGIHASTSRTYWDSGRTTIQGKDDGSDAIYQSQEYGNLPNLEPSWTSKYELCTWSATPTSDVSFPFGSSELGIVIL